MDTHHPPVRVAVIGTGLAGLATAYLLRHANHSHSDGQPVVYDVHLFERNDQLGMDAASVSVKTEEGKEVRVDVPMRSINGGSHSRVKKLYDRLRVPLVASDFGYSFSTLHASSSPSLNSPSSSFPAPPPSASASDFDSGSVPSTPPPSYSFSPSPRPSTPPSSKRASPSSPARPRPTQTTHLLYSGSSGLAWPPLPFPSSVLSSPSPLSSRLHHLARSLTLSLLYLYLLALSFFYVSLGLARPPAPAPPLGARTGVGAHVRRRWVQRFGVAGEPLDRWMARHGLGTRVGRGGAAGGEGAATLGELVRVLMAAVATVGVDEAGRMPVGELLEYITSTFLSPHYRTSPTFGVRGIVRALVAPLPPSNIHLSTTIVRVEASEGAGGRGYTVVSAGEKEREETRLQVDHLVLATQADQAAALLATLSPPSLSPSPSSCPALARTLAALRTFTYARTLVVTHRDESVLPPRAGDRRELNLAVFAAPPRDVGGEKQEKQAQGEADEGDTLPPSSVQTTHIISPYPSLSSSPQTPLILQTTNPLVPVPPALVYSKTWFARAVVNGESQKAVGLFAPPPSGSSASASAGVAGASLQGLPLGHVGEGGGEGKGAGEGRRGGVWFAGSYLAPGIPLLEGCVASAEGVVEGLGRRCA
ncbi:hypothetical protein JCM6882_006046 [Rhodosporidiobolus microsporus]